MGAGEPCDPEAEDTVRLTVRCRGAVPPLKASSDRSHGIEEAPKATCRNTRNPDEAVSDKVIGCIAIFVDATAGAAKGQEQQV
jgi:hypothetical protein